MIRPCDIAITCPGIGTPDPDWPVTNYSAEAPDPFLWSTPIWDPYDPYAPIPLIVPTPDTCTPDTQQTINTMATWLEQFPDSQAYTNLRALARELGCNFPAPPHDPNNPERDFYNSEQCASATCPSGAIFGFCVPAGAAYLTLDTPILSEVTSPYFGGYFPPIVTQDRTAGTETVTVCNLPDENSTTVTVLDLSLGFAFEDMANAWAAAYAAQQVSDNFTCEDPPEGDPNDPPFRSGLPYFSGNPGWMCLGESLVLSANTYQIVNPGATEWTFAITSGSLAPGTSLVQVSTTAAAIVGTPTTAGIYDYHITATSTTLPTMTITVADELRVMTITNADTLPDAVAGTPYGPEQLTTSGTVGTCTFTVVGSLPTGFTLGTDGKLISDDTTVAGDYTFTVKVEDADEHACDVDCSITVAGACPDFSGLSWTAPNLDNGVDGSAVAVASGDTVQFGAVSGTLACAICNTMVGTLNYTGDVFDAYVYLDVLHYTDFPSGLNTQVNFGFNIKIGFTYLAQIFTLSTPTNKLRIIDADGTRDFTGDMPGSFVIHFQVPASVGAIIRFEGAGTGWFYICPDLSMNQTSLIYQFQVSCTAPP